MKKNNNKNSRRKAILRQQGIPLVRATIDGKRVWICRGKAYDNLDQLWVSLRRRKIIKE